MMSPRSTLSSWTASLHVVLSCHRRGVAALTLLTTGLVVAVVILERSPTQAAVIYHQYHCAERPDAPCALAAARVLSSSTRLTAVLGVLRVYPLIGLLGAYQWIASDRTSKREQFLWHPFPGRRRWFFATLLVLVGSLTVAVVVATYAVHPWVQALNGVGAASPFQSEQFDVSVLPLLGWTWFATALGTLAATVRRHHLALIATLCVLFAAEAANFAWGDRWLWTLDPSTTTLTYFTVLVGPLRVLLTRTGHPLNHAWLLSGNLRRRGHYLSFSQSQAVIRRALHMTQSPKEVASWLAHHGYVNVVTYQPPNHWLVAAIVATASSSVLSLVLVSVALVRITYTPTRVRTVLWRKKFTERLA